MPQSAPAATPVAAPPPSGGGIGGFLSNLLNPQDAGKNQTISWLRKQGMDEGTATMFASSKPALQQYLLQRLRRVADLFQGMLPSRTSDQVDFQSLVDQTKGQTFLQAFQSLKGGGAITDIEGAKATNAISRLGNQRLSDQDYLQAITDLEDVIKTGVARAQHQAGGGVAPSAAQPSAPQSSATSTPSSDAPPPSYTGKNWKYMPPEARKLWQ
jgi:hypothetical protein